MSFTSIEPATSRLHRSELAVPGSNTALFEKAAKSAADIVFLDVEDAVAPDDKAQARKNIIQGLNEIDWGAKTMMVRINGLDTHYMYRDVVDIVEACPRLDMILIPKAGVAADVYARRHDGDADRDREEAHEANRLRSADRDRARHGQCRGHRPVEQAARGDVLRRGRLRRLDPRAHHGDRRRQSRLRRAHRQGCRRQARLFLDRSLACGADAHDGRLPRLRIAPDRRAVRRLQRSRRLPCRRQSRRRARL